MAFTLRGGSQFGDPMGCSMKGYRILREHPEINTRPKPGSGGWERGFLCWFVTN